MGRCLETCTAADARHGAGQVIPAAVNPIVTEAVPLCQLPRARFPFPAPKPAPRRSRDRPTAPLDLETMRELPYSVLDVFAERPLEGNPLAVFHDGRGLSAERMQALARETNLSETSFVLPSEDPDEDRRDGVRVRIFTTEEELPFAGHPTLGTAAWLHLHHPPTQGAETVTLRLNVGPIPVRFPAQQRADRAGLYGEMRQRDPEFGPEYDPPEIARLLGVPLPDLLPGYRPQAVSTGNAFCIVPLRSVEALGRLAIPQREASAWLRTRGIRWFYCIAPEHPGTGTGTATEPAVWRARMQWNGGEDPATGSAAGPCIAWLVRVGLAASATPTVVRQGVEILRPSRLTVRATTSGTGVTNTFVGGRTVPVATGRFSLLD